MTKDEIYLSKPWIKFYDQGVPEFLNYEEICIPGLLDRTAAAYPRRMALNFQGYAVSYGQLKEMVDRFASCLADFGIRKGDTVGLILPNVIPCVVAYYAIQKVGAVVVMNNPLYSDRELAHQLSDSGVKVLIAIDLITNRMIDLRPKTRIKQIIYTSIGDYLPFPQSLLFPLVAKKKGLLAKVKYAGDVYTWKGCLSRYSPHPPQVTLTFDDPAIYQYTGGTTGVSKGVILTHGNLSKQVQQLESWFPNFKRGDQRISIGALPIFHVFGMTCSMNFPILMGWGNILVPKPQPQPLLEVIRKYRPTFAPLVPTMYIGMLSHPDVKKTDMTSLSECFSGSAPLPVEVIYEFERISGSIIVEGFGMTETSPVTHANPFNGVRKPGSIGIPLPDTEARIVDLDTGDRDMPLGEPGELIIRGPQVTKGYLNNSEETQILLRDGWCYTGDVATMDEDGYFYIVDRKKDLIISGGFNVYPRDIDEVFYAHPKVREACAIGIPDAKRGENVKVFIVLKDGMSATQQEMIDFCKDKLATYKLPTVIEFREDLPKTTIGKVLRRELKTEALTKKIP